ncbi:Maff2 family mobile element protein [Bulleidia sp. HCP3S3_F2]|uniref:Maff2 family mobile element protein n=1 Tax=unclassified Bulleidia TaxID=2704656 RepID=UPI003F8BE467
MRRVFLYLHFHYRWAGYPSTILRIRAKEDKLIAFFNSAVGVLQTLVVALGAGLGI